MTDYGKDRRPLVADRRTGRPKAAAKPAAKAETRPSEARRTSKPARVPRQKGPRGPLGWILAPFIWLIRLVWKITWRVGLVSAVLLAGAVFYVSSTLPPDASQLYDARVRGSVTLLDRDGNVFAWRGDQYQQVTSDSVSRHLRNAVIATEDRRFYSHFGLSPRGIASAIRINIAEGRSAFSGNGGSTITQQVSKLLCMGNQYDPAVWKNEAEYEADCRQSSLWRKAREAIYAMAMEVKYSKDEILTIYLNRAYLGGGARGFEAASQVYFGKHAAEIEPAEAAMLAGLLTAPSRYAPTSNLQRSRDRAKVVIGLMEEQGFLTKAEADHARANPATLSRAAQDRAGGDFVDWVMEAGPSDFTRKTTEDVELLTTFDPKLQKAAEEALAHIFETKVKAGSEAQAAIVVMSADGAVRAMVGGRRLNQGGLFNRAVQAKRQTGSSFKPFVYAAALDLGRSPYDIIVDEPITINVKGSGPWSPQNYTRRFEGPMTLADALAKSQNIPVIRLAQSVGLDTVRKVAADFGIESDLALGPALALGVSESTLIEMTGAYAGILNGGTSVTPFGIRQLRIKGDDEPLMDQDGGMGERVIMEKSAKQLTWMMWRVIQQGTGTRAKLPDRQAAGKTGTTQAARDAWFLGFTADYVAGVWMGYDDNRPLTGVTGGGLPADIWKEVMLRVHQGLPARPLPMLDPGQAAGGGGYVVPPSPPPAPSGGVIASAPPEPVDDEAESILMDVLDDLLRQ